MLHDNVWKRHLLELIIFMLFVYFVLFIMTLVIVILEGDKIALTLKSKLKVLFFNPIFMISYVPCAIKALTLKEVKFFASKFSLTSMVIAIYLQVSKALCQVLL